MINQNTLDRLNAYGFGADIDSFESYIIDMRNAAAIGEPIADNAIYDAYIRLLKELKPDSVVFTENWETEENELEEYDELLNKYGMCSITTYADEEELSQFKSVIDMAGGNVDLCVSVKENGHGVRAVYEYGQLVSATTRGRYKKGRDITRHAMILMPNTVDDWSEIPLVEIRGEVLVKIETFKQYLSDKLKTPLSSVTSLIKDSATDDEIGLMNFVAYKFLTNSEDIQVDTLIDEFKILESAGFETPQYKLAPGVTSRNFIQYAYNILHGFETLMDNNKIEYSCDGLVLAINDRDLFYSLGKNGNAWISNFAMKMGRYWESNIYSSKILDIQFVPGKSYMTPKAIIEPVVCANGAKVTYVPLYNVGVMDRYMYIPGETIYFRFGGEQSVLTCDSEGNSVAVQ